MSLPRHWRAAKVRYGMVGEVCNSCGKNIFPPRDVCPHCAEMGQATRPMSGKGTVYSHATVYNAPAGYTEQQPYAVALIKLEEGPVVAGQLTDVDAADVTIGMPVEMVTRKVRTEGDSGLIVYGYKFRPQMERAAS